MSVTPPAPRIIVSDTDGTRWLLLLDPERAVGYITPVLERGASDRHGEGSRPSGIEFSLRRPA